MGVATQQGPASEPKCCGRTAHTFQGNRCLLDPGGGGAKAAIRALPILRHLHTQQPQAGAMHG